MPLFSTLAGPGVHIIIEKLNLVFMLCDKRVLLNKSAPVECKCNLVSLIFCAVFKPIWNSVNIV